MPQGVLLINCSRLRLSSAGAAWRHIAYRQGPQSVAMTRWDEVVDQVPRNDASKRLLHSTRLQHACGGVRASVMGSRHTCTLCAVQLQPLQCSSSSCNAFAYPTLYLRSGQLPLAHDGTCEDVCKHAAYEHAAYGAELGVKIHCCVSCTPSALSGACSRPVGFCCDEANARPGGLMHKCYYHDMQQFSIHAQLRRGRKCLHSSGTYVPINSAQPLLVRGQLPSFVTR